MGNAGSYVVDEYTPFPALGGSCIINLRVPVPAACRLKQGRYQAFRVRRVRLGALFHPLREMMMFSGWEFELRRGHA
jgi:hypothetical protein